MKKHFSYTRAAFTLAEVLITLAVIGIVAALTIPTLISDVSRKQHLVAFKKKYAELTHAINLSTIDNGSTSNWDYTLEDEEFFGEYLAPYLKTQKCDECWISRQPKGLFFETPAYAAPARPPASLEECFAACPTVPEDGFCMGEEGCQGVLNTCANGGDGDFEKYYGADNLHLCTAWLEAQNAEDTIPEEPDITYSLVNGSTLGLVKGNSLFYLYLDVNGLASPNKYGVDKFVFTVANNRVSPLGHGLNDLTEGDFGCSQSGNGMYCGAMIMQNNWEYPDNYPKL